MGTCPSAEDWAFWRQLIPVHTGHYFNEVREHAALHLLSAILDIIANATNSLGFGWLFAYLIMSGSPVAAATLTFFDAGVIDELSTFTMITGSRLGASFIVLFIGFIYVLRGRDRATSLSMGILSFTVTATTYLPGLVIGIVLLKTGVLDSIQLPIGDTADFYH